MAVFDVAQTEGEELPVVCRNLEGDDPASRFTALVGRAAGLGCGVELTELHGSTNGGCAFARRRIRVECRNHPSQRVKRLAHDLRPAPRGDRRPARPLAELEAESTACVVCRSLGLDSSDYSIGYVACWAGGGPEAVVSSPHQRVGCRYPADRRRHPSTA